MYDIARDTASPVRGRSLEMIMPEIEEFQDDTAVGCTAAVVSVESRVLP